MDTRVLLQVRVAEEETKFGLTPYELLAYFSARVCQSLGATHLCGLMGMATNTDDTGRIRSDFSHIANLRRDTMECAPDLRGFHTLSMGMSGDYPIAIECGATLVRVGTDIFGSRNY